MLPISKKLQTVKIDYLEAKASVDDAISVLTTRRSEFDHLDQVYRYACDTMKDFDVPVVMPRVNNRQINSANPPADSPAEYYRLSGIKVMTDIGDASYITRTSNVRWLSNVCVEKFNTERSL
jgi:hypothetical protein